MSGNTIPLNTIVRAGVKQGADSDRIIRIAEQHTDRCAWDAAERLLFFKKGSILELPFEDNSIQTLSSLCVVEHIGLGRYGDPVDSFGSEKAIKELKRVLQVGGIILFSVPVDNENKIYFNAHRAFAREYILLVKRNQHG